MNHIKENINHLKNRSVLYVSLGTALSLLAIFAGIAIATGAGKNKKNARTAGNSKDASTGSEPIPESKPGESQQEHSAAVETSNFNLIYHGKNGEIIHIDTISYPVDAYGQATEPIYNGCDYVPKNHYQGAAQYAAYTFPDGRGADSHVDLRNYIINGGIHLKME